MNYLAHFHLAWPDEDLLAGGLEGDYFKGPLNKQLPAGLERGVRLHRSIDAFTDQHPALAELRAAFGPELRRYAGILVDLSFDHFLSLHWDTYADQPLQEFNSSVYKGLMARRPDFSPAARRMLDRIVQYDLLGVYGDWETVPASASRIGERFTRGNPFLAIDDELTALRPQMEAAFIDFYPELQAFVGEQRRQLN